MSESTFDASKNYKKIRYLADRDLLNTELNEAQDIEAHERRTLLDRVFPQGAIISGFGGSVDGDDVTIESGTVYMDGFAVNVPGGVLSFAEPGEHLIYVDVFRRDVTATEDPSLVNPLTGEPTAEREKWIATLQGRDTSDDPLPEGALGRSVVPVYVFDRDTGELRPYAGYAGGGTGDIISALASHVGHGGLDRHPAASSEIAGFMSTEHVDTMATHGSRLNTAESDISGLQDADQTHGSRLDTIETALPDKADNSYVSALSHALATHKGSADHDPRYYTKTQADDGFAPKSHVGSGGTAQHPAATGSTAGFMSASDKTQLGDHASRISTIETTLPNKADNSDVTAVSNALNTHKSSGDHDLRYYTKTQADNNYAPKSHVGAGGTAQHPVATGSTAGFMAHSDKTKLDHLDAELEDARHSDRYGSFFSSLDDRLEYTEFMAITGATYIVAASDSVRRQAAHRMCNGINDQVEINEMLNLLRDADRQGGAVLLLAGTYVISGTIEIPENCVLMGQGPATIIKLKDGHNTGISLIKNKSHGDRTVVTNLAIDGNKAAQTAGDVVGIELLGQSESVLSGYHAVRTVWCRNTWAGVFCKFTSSSDISHSMFYNGHGVLVSYASANISIIGNMFMNPSIVSQVGVGIDSRDSSLRKVQGVIAKGNHIQHCYTGIGLGEGSQVCIVDANNIVSCAHGIVATSASSSTGRLSFGHQIARNTITITTHIGIQLLGVGAEDLQVVGNRVDRAWDQSGGSTRGAVEIDGAVGSMLQCNRVRKGTGTAGYGILIKAQTTSAWVTNNDLRGAGAVSGMHDAGTGTVTSAGNQT